MPGALWYIKRLRVMSSREVLHRLFEQLTLVRLYFQYRASRPIRVDGNAFQFCTATAPQIPEPQFDFEALEASRQDLLKGQLQVYDFTWQWDASRDPWHRAPDTGRTWPRKFFASIPFRDGNPVGDVRKLWEVSRLQHLVDLALLSRTGTSEERGTALSLICAQLDSWVEDNPPLEGANYISSMECALRIVAVCHALDLVRDRTDERRPWQALVTIVASHAPLIEKRLSLHSSAGNHLLSEGVGLVYAGALFPEFGEAARWLSNGLTILTREAARQVLSDGGGIEQAFGYHRYNIQLLALTVALLERSGIEVPVTMSEALARGTRFLSIVAPNPENFPYVGDSDSGFALSRFHLVSGASSPPVAEIETFPESGYTAARISTDPPIRLLFDHGTLGMAPGFGHGHADALAVLLSSNGQDLMVDAGTYTYTGDQRWRRYFRSTLAHNTVTVDGQDQSRQEGCFLWSRPYCCSLVATQVNQAGGRLLAQHDGYRHLAVRHVRGIAWNSGQWLVVWDRIEGEGTHRLELHWHLGSQPLRRVGRNVTLAVADGQISLEFTGGEVSVHCGEEDPAIGWRSPRYGVRVPIPTLKVASSGSVPHEFITLLRIREARDDHASIQEALEWMKTQVTKGLP